MVSKVECPICGKSLSKITATHLKLHNMTTGEFRILYPEYIEYMITCGDFRTRKTNIIDDYVNECIKRNRVYR